MAATASSGNKKFGGFTVSDKVEPELAKATDVWSVFSPLAGHVPKDALNLGQGFMNWGPPPFVKEAFNSALEDVAANHYSLPRGRANLRNALSKYLSPGFNLGRELDPASEITVTAGANEGMFAFASAFLQSGDEVIVFEPFFDQYIAQIKFNGGIPVYVPLRPPASASNSNIQASEWSLDIEELRKAITPKTKMIWVNSPHNPIGKVFTESELREIGNLAKEKNLMILSDEVYDCLTFDGKPHVRIAGLDDFWQRTVTVGSAGKSFSCTGWRVGWCVGPAELLTPLVAAHTRIVFCVNSPAQEAAAAGITAALENNFFETQIKEYAARRAILLEKLDKLGLPYTVPEGAYFVLVNAERLEIPKDFEVIDLIKDRPKDWKACWFVAQTAKVVTIPVTDFYAEEHSNLGENYIRIAFCKDEATLAEAGDRLLALKPFIRKA